MKVWVRKTKRRSNCFYCGKEIKLGYYQVVCQYFMPVRGGKVWTKRMIFHATPINCWLDRAIAEIESRPFVETRGKPPLNLSDPDKEKRCKILMRRASVVQRLGKEMFGEMRPKKLLHLTELLEKLKGEIEPYGGVPKSWNERIGGRK